MAKKICSKELEEMERKNKDTKTKLEMALLLQQKEKTLMNKIVSEDCSISLNLRNKANKNVSAKDSNIEVTNKSNQKNNSTDKNIKSNIK